MGCACTVCTFSTYFKKIINDVYLSSSILLFVEECSYWLPLYGSMCCRLAAQPHCMTQQMISGCLKVKVSLQLNEINFLHPYIVMISNYHSNVCGVFLILAIRRGAPKLDKSLCCPKRNKPFLLSPARRCGGKCSTSLHYWYQQG